MTTATATGLVTAEDLLAMPDDGYCYELVKGALTAKMPPPGFEHGAVVGRFAAALGSYADENDYGTVVDNAGFLLEADPDTVRAPDVAWLAPGRVVGSVPGYPGVIPDLAVEVKSPNDSRREMRERALMWLRYGSREVWVAIPYPVVSVIRYRPGQQPVTLYEDDVLDGGDLLPGFRVPVWRLFRRHRRQVSLGEQAEEQV